MGAPTYPTAAGDTLAVNAPPAQAGGSGKGERLGSERVTVGSPLAVRQHTFVVDIVRNVSKIAYWRAPYCCRIRGIGLISSLTTTAANTLTVTAQVGTTNVIAATTFDNTAPTLTADTLFPVYASSTPALTNYEDIAEDDVLKFTIAAADQAAWADQSLQISIIVEPKLAVTGVTAQYNRAYLPEVRGKDS